jgi:CubicO group peptidase (beta-lactamase class C family)
VSRRGEIAHLSCIGEARPGEALKEDAIFRIASMTKPITSIAFMMLVEEGKVALSDPLQILPRVQGHRRVRRGRRQRPLPDPAADAADPHDRPAAPYCGLTYGFQERTPGRCGLPQARIDDFDADYTMDSFIANLAKIPLQFDPGAHWNYSMATDVLGAVIERIEGKPFAEVLQERIFGPLGMVDTGFKVPADQQHRLTDAYAFHPARQEAGFRQRRDAAAGRRIAAIRAAAGSLRPWPIITVSA